ncbi:hypothetical protein G7Y79_00006g019190 [Physcia stellaris]|nr:hypothetical protein G7Y79_00006g019190 [Physcia stellaris]
MHLHLPSTYRRLPNPYLLPSGDRYLFFDRTGSVLVQPRNPFDFVFYSLPATYEVVSEKLQTEGSARHGSWEFEKTVEGRRQGTEDYCRLEVLNTPNPALGLGWNDTIQIFQAFELKNRLEGWGFRSARVVTLDQQTIIRARAFVGYA